MRSDHRPNRCHPERTREGSGFKFCSRSLRGVPLRMTCLSTLCVICTVIVGCASVPAGKSVVSDVSAKPNASDVEFWHTLQDRPLATNDDAFHGLLIYLDGSDPSTD